MKKIHARQLTLTKIHANAKKKFLQLENSVTFLMVRPLQKSAVNQILCWLIPCSQMSFRYKVSNKTRMRKRESIKRPFNF